MDMLNMEQRTLYQRRFGQDQQDLPTARREAVLGSSLAEGLSHPVDPVNPVQKNAMLTDSSTEMPLK
jgi:hypothetical protein